VALIDNLISYWKLDEASGDALDAHGTNDLTETSGTIASATGKIGNARDFESADTEYFEIADNADLSTGDIDFTIAAWVNLESLTNGTIASKYETVGNQREYLFFYNANDHVTNNRFSFAVSSDGTGAALVTIDANNFGAPSTGTWYHVVAWHDSVSNQIGISVNAGTPDTASHSAGVFNSTTPFRLGAIFAGGGQFYQLDGLLDEVGFWKRVLTSQERTDLYNGGSGLSYDDFDAGGDTFTASAAVTTGSTTASGSATFTKPVYTGAAAVSAGAATCSGSATFTKPTYTGAAAVTTGATTASGSASFVAPVYTASAAVSAGRATAAGSATFAAPIYTAQAALTAGGATAAGSAVFALSVHIAQAAVLAGPATALGSATFTAAPAVVTPRAALPGSVTRDALTGSIVRDSLTGSV
jgi:concanavalin A-like lectin/glucanase superfamily protein